MSEVDVAALRAEIGPLEVCLRDFLEHMVLQHPHAAMPAMPTDPEIDAA